MVDRLPDVLGMPVRISAMVEALPCGLALLDPQGRFLFCNSAFIASFGIEGDPRGQDPAQLLIAEDRADFVAAMDSARANESGTSELRARLANHSDEYVTLVMAHSPPAAAMAGSELLIGVRDIREQLRLEAKVAQVTKMQAVGQLAGGVAHDFNNVLTAVLGLCDQLLTRHMPGDTDFDDIDQIRINANRAAALVRQLLAFARQQTLQPRLLDLRDVLDPLRPLLQRLLGPAIELEYSYSHAAGRVRADPGQLEQVVVNLAVNARDAMLDGGRLSVATRLITPDAVAGLNQPIMPAIGFVELSVNDTGTGIAPEIASRIFEPFFTTKPLGHGTGLGLASVYGIVKQSEGFIFMHSRPEGGTRFSVYLPADGSGAIAAASTAEPEAAATLRGRVLLVEDERAVRLVVERSLQRMGLDVTSVGDAADALDMLQDTNGDFDLLITDLVMPGMDGVQLVHAAQERYPTLRTILMSGYAEPPQRAAAGEYGMHFLAKPFASSELLAVVHQAFPSLKF
ncbi:PAS domain-containing sensor histidine kinase [Polymorphobacter arshaanensis]|uniref:histidine kinase n=1 Tax=Glacieibacterium arshaanense TaxID=2511025 RepID=A0A4Y9EPF1_9SPHN|nr:PAS domain-containing sensor histidine kinase [Polymorphobacter arshaanensis]TFU03743.1 PAS domain-containing sensor histidine kinase [Polymorphobacter arshaanensis]